MTGCEIGGTASPPPTASERVAATVGVEEEFLLIDLQAARACFDEVVGVLEADSLQGRLAETSEHLQAGIVPPSVDTPAGAMLTLLAVGLFVAAVRTLVFWREHSGHRIPTGVGVMQSGQIGRPQDEQETPVSREGWR